MRAWDLTTPAARLRQALKDLQATRNDVATHWNDDTNRKFCEKYLDPLELRVRTTIGAIGELAGALDAAERECGDYD